MEDLNLTETEMRYFGDLFLCCDEESNGKIPILKATELFRSSNISNDVLKQIMDISVAPLISSSLNYMNRKQFYSALKLIAAHQQNLALKPELLSSSLDLSLPRFTWTLNCETNSDLIQLSSSPKEYLNSKRDRNFGGNSHGNYEPIRLSSNLSDSDVPQTLSQDVTEGISTDSEIESETQSQQSGSHGRRAKTGSPWSTASDSPTPTNSVAERVHPVWEHSATGRGVWPANTAEEHTQLLGTEEESSDRHSSEEEGDGAEVWSISDVQARHYAAQFAQLRPERGLLSGQTARTFFEKSRLPVNDLRKIWQLADITKDGALSLEEFSIAMHLIVLRRNNIPLPEALPGGLVPREHRPAASPPPALVSSADFTLPPASPPVPEQPPPTKQWTKFVDSPTSTLSSPGPKPVNFDFHKASVERDPLIYHPVAVRVTPDGTAPDEPEIRIQRPQPRKPVKSAGVLPPPPEPRKEPPPPPPPRPLRQHARSSSLDLTRLSSAPPPPPPPRSPDRPRMHGAFEVYRKPAVPDETDLRALHEQNALLHRVCRTLCGDLADVQREREALRLQLEASTALTNTTTTTTV